MNTVNNNTFLALKQAESKLNLAKTQLVNAQRMNTREFGEAFVQKRVREAEAAVLKWEAEIERIENGGVSNETPVSETSTVVSEKSKRKAAKKAAKRNNIMRSSQLPSTTRTRRNNNNPRLSQAQIRELQLDRELQRYEKFALKKELQKKLEDMPSNQGMHIGGILHVGKANPEGNSERFTYTKRETDGGESKVFTYVREPSSDGYVRETKYFRGVEVSQTVRRNPFGKCLNKDTKFVSNHADFPVLERAEIVPTRKYRSWAAAATGDTTAPVPETVVETTPATAPVETTPENNGFTVVKTQKRRDTGKGKIILTPAMQSRVSNMPSNVGMFVRGKIFWGKQPKSPHSTKMATKLATVDGAKGVLRYTWNSRVYREQFKAQNTREWITIRNDRCNGDQVMSSFC
jgi:hypothetical protein